MSSRIAPLLIFAYGNPSRGDDALGPAMFELLERHQQESSKLDSVELLTDFQLQIEHAVDFQRRESVLFIDADVSCSAPFECRKLRPEKDQSFTTHSMSPAAVLAVYKQINHCEPPPAYLLTIRAYEFGLGRAISNQANANLQKAYDYVIDSYIRDQHRPSSGMTRK